MTTRKKVLIGIGGLFGLIIVALLIAPMFIDINDYKPQIVTAAKQATGRDLAIEGPIKLSLLPTPSVSVSGVKLANMAGAKSPHMVEIKSVTVKPALFALIGGNIEVSSVTIVEPKIAVEVNAQGKASWDFAPAGEPGKPVQAGSPQAKAPDPKSTAGKTPEAKAPEVKVPEGKGGGSQSFTLGSLTVEDGALAYNDAKSGTALTVDKINMTMSLSSLGSGAKPVAAAPPGVGKPIDTSAMRAYDATVKLTAASVVSSQLRLTDADLSMALKDGVLTLQRLKVGVYGGTIDLSGTVNGSQPALAIDMKGDVNNLSLTEMLRQATGSNQFGSAVKVTIEGKLSANGITMKGAGSTAEQIKGSLAGGAQLGGNVLVSANQALTMLGSAATGAAGGAIDKTLGSALGAAGQKGGVGTGNLLNAISLVLNRFVNHDNPISGRVDIANGILTDKGLTVQGKGANANIDTRTNLVNSTTDTTINFVITEDSSAPYLIATIHGPTSNLSYNVARGTAKDPPGMASTLGDAVANPVQKVIPGVGGTGGSGGSVLPKIPNPFGR
jgi:uncharacterized protein involved in outer membrane biogenesis